MSRKPTNLSVHRHRNRHALNADPLQLVPLQCSRVRGNAQVRQDPDTYATDHNQREKDSSPCPPQRVACGIPQTTVVKQSSTATGTGTTPPSGHDGPSGTPGQGILWTSPYFPGSHLSRLPVMLAVSCRAGGYTREHVDAS
jgi:hypothetical protein